MPVLNQLSRATEEDMRGMQKSGLFIAAAAVVASGACGNRNSASDVKTSDLELAPRGGNAQAVVSAIEAGPAAAPKTASPQKVVKPVSHPAPLRAAPLPAPPPVKVAQQAPPPAQPAPAPQEKERDPAPLPPFPDAQGKARDRGSSTEGQIFQRMPWIRP
jgi:hypothetical protein